MEEGLDKTLNNNAIKQFIIRIDFADDCKLDFIAIANKLVKFYGRIEKSNHINYQLNLNECKLDKKESYIYILKRDNGVQVKLIEALNAIIFETVQYKNKDSYYNDMEQIINSVKSDDLEIKAKRIGMRFINNFTCKNSTEVSKILIGKIAKKIRDATDNKYISRTISVEEYNYDNYKQRVQYGIPNRFYPAIISNYDLLFDIDSYDDVIQVLDNCNMLETLNHAAYQKFIEFIKPTYLNILK